MDLYVETYSSCIDPSKYHIKEKRHWYFLQKEADWCRKTDVQSKKEMISDAEI